MTDDLPANQHEDETDAVRAGLIPADSVYCEHGTYVGGWAGGDYLCGPCEDGISQAQLVREYLEACRAGDRCEPGRGGHQRPDGSFAGFTWVVRCVAVGPCAHWGDYLVNTPPKLTYADACSFWLRAGLIYHDAPEGI